ncbi:MAG: hypothetical protein M1822_004731 [Bathelium mastoideum]|nr:MAG: hypothetical protein M1822_004731 [Bathelium mastoideum]
MATALVDYESILQTFDDLTAEGFVHYSPPRTVRLEDDGFPLEFHVTGALLNKPMAEDRPPSLDEVSECFGPGSDIPHSNPKELIDTVLGTHLLVVNKFSVFRPQLLLLTANSYRRQDEQLHQDDFRVVHHVLASLKRPLYAIYNCTSISGASKRHKHLHILPRPEYLFPDDRQFDPKNIPFKYFLRYLDDGLIDSPDGSQVLSRIYEDLLAAAKQALDLYHEDVQDSCPHNVVLTKDWLIVISRRSSTFKGAITNAAGMVGSVWLKDESQLDNWQDIGPKNILSHLGLPVA